MLLLLLNIVNKISTNKHIRKQVNIIEKKVYMRKEMQQDMIGSKYTELVIISQC